MIETIYTFSRDPEQKTIEKIVTDGTLQYLHMALPRGEGLPEHSTNAPVYMTVVKGTLTIQLGEEDVCEYAAGTLLKIPFDTRMRVQNLHGEMLELFVVKAPAPKG